MSFDQRQKAKIIIHSCAISAAGWSALMATAPLVGPVTGDTVGLEGITIVMGVLLSREVFHQEFRESLWKGAAAAALQFALGAMIIKAVFSLIPFFGNAASAVVSLGTVEAVGWGLFSILEEGKRPEDLSPEELQSYFRQGKQLAKESKKEFGWLDQLPSDIKDRYEKLSAQLSDSKLSSEQKAAIVKEIEDLLAPYRPR